MRDQGAEESRSGPRPFRLLLVDDSRAVLAIVARVLETADLGPMELRTAPTGEDALEVLGEFMPDLIVSDWHMPKMSGIEMLQTLRQTGLNDLAVGFVTTETSRAQLAQAESSGSAFIIHKPFRDEDLIDAVRQVRAARAPKPAPRAAAKPKADTAASGQALRHMIKQRMPQVPVRITESEPVGVAQLTARNLLVLFSEKLGGAVCALAAANVPAVCMLGGGASHAEPQSVRQAIRDDQPTEAMVEGAIGFFRACVDILPMQFAIPPTDFKGANLVSKDFAQLRSAIEQGRQRVDYRLTIPGYGDGHVVFIRL